ncbi:hypothetical protein MRX96_013565 [Rhipicephalus microplus]
MFSRFAGRRSGNQRLRKFPLAGFQVHRAIGEPCASSAGRGHALSRGMSTGSWQVAAPSTKAQHTLPPAETCTEACPSKRRHARAFKQPFVNPACSVRTRSGDGARIDGVCLFRNARCSDVWYWRTPSAC